MRIFFKSAFAFGVVLVHQLIVFLFRPASHVGLVGVDLLLLEVLRARVFLYAFFLIVAYSQQDGLFFERIKIDIIDV